MKTILVPGGAGFIGSHTVAALLARGYKTVTIDNFSNGHKDTVPGGEVMEGDIRDTSFLAKVFSTHKIDAVIHFAAFIEAGESVVNPLSFYDNNTHGSLCLLRAMLDAGVNALVFSSTAAVYGQSKAQAGNISALSETLPKNPINPYGQSKWAVECMLRDTAAANGLRAIALRYFNAAGSDPTGNLGERHDPETHLIPLVLQAASGRRDNIKIFGTDYPTPDGTCIRDYIHVCDLAEAHVLALDHLFNLPDSQQGFYDAFNLGTGTGFSVREVIESVRRVTGTDFTVIEEARRAGDPATLVANSDKAQQTFGWRPEYPALDDMVAHAWNFMKGQ